MPAHYNVWHWGPNDPILQELSCGIVKTYTGIYVVRSTLVNLPHGRGTNFPILLQIWPSQAKE